MGKANGYKKFKDEEPAVNLTVYHGQQLKEGEVLLTPEELSYFQLAHYIPDPESKDPVNDPLTWLRYGGVIFVSLFASLYYKPFCASFTTEALTTLGADQKKAHTVGNVSGWASLFVNFAIGIVSLLSAWWSLSQLPKKLKEADMENYVDQVMVAQLVGVIVASIIGVFPNFVFINDTMKKKGASLGYTYFMQVIQFIAGTAMNIRGAMSVLNIESEWEKAAEEVKYLILCDLNDLLDDPLTDEELHILSRGENHIRKHTTLRKWLGYGGYALPILYILGIFAASATIFAPFLTGVGLVVGALATLNIIIALISSGLLLLLMGFTNGSLFDRLFMGGDKKILDVKGKDDIPDSPIGVLILALIIGFGLGLLSMGGPAAVIFNYMVPSILVAFFGGMAAGFGMNCSDLFNLANKYLNMVFQFVKSLALFIFKGVPMKPQEVPWQSHEEFVKSRMKIISDMDAHETLRRYGDRVKISDQQNIPEEPEEEGQPRILYDGTLRYNANKKFEKLDAVLTGDNINNADDGDFEAVRDRAVYKNRHLISNAWKHAQRDDDAARGMVMGGAAA